MGHFPRILFFALLFFVPANAMARPAEDASAVIDRWADAFSANDLGTIQSLYTHDAILFGVSSPRLYQGRDAIRDYYKAASVIGSKVTMGERRAYVLADEAVAVTGFYRVDLLSNGQIVPRPARFTFVVVKRGDNWLIAHEHSSVLPPAPLQ